MAISKNGQHTTIIKESPANTGKIKMPLQMYLIALFKFMAVKLVPSLLMKSISSGVGLDTYNESLLKSYHFEKE